MNPLVFPRQLSIMFTKKDVRMWWGFLLLFLIKIILLATFSSDYSNKLFVPFIKHFLSTFDNPWQYFFQHPSEVEFPYNPLMLYILSFCYWPMHALGITSIIMQNLFLKLPTLFSDILITYLLIKIFPTKIKEVCIFYCISPIIIYAAYLHSQLDLLPTAILFLAVYFLKKRQIFYAACCFGLAISIKFHVVAALPLMTIYLLKNFDHKKVLIFSALTLAIYCLFVAPYLLTKGFFYLVLTHPKQMMMFDISVHIGFLKIYLPVFALLTIYGRFFIYEKINNDLLDAFLCLVFSLFILLIIPAPAWYIWMLPFLSMLFIKHAHSYQSLLLAYGALNGAYVLFFVFFYPSPLHDLFFLTSPINLKIHHEKLSNIAFTLLEATLALILYLMYKLGVKSNSIYKKKHALVIGISGDSGAGKSTLMTDLQELFGDKATLIEGDGDHRWERGDSHWKTFTHLNPKANYLHRQTENIMMLKMGKPVYRSDYNHHTGKFDQPHIVQPNDFIILSGLHSFYLPTLRKVIDLKIYIDPDQLLRTHWKIVRDSQERGHSKEKILEQIAHRQHDANKHIEPQKNFADLIISYLPAENFDLGNGASSPPLKLHLTLDSSIKLEALLHALTQENIDLTWNYADDLKTQYLTLTQAPSTIVLEKIAKNILENIEEITGNAMTWSDGYRGFVQLIVLLILSEKMKDYF